MTTQFNVRIRKSAKQNILRDRVRSGATNDIITEVAIEDFFTRHSPEQREKFYRAHSRKPYSRKS